MAGTPNREKDVVFGSRGNRHIPAYRELILEHVGDYISATDTEARTRVLMEIKSAIEANGGKFWVEAEKGTFEKLEDPIKYIRTSVTVEIGNQKRRKDKQNTGTGSPTPSPAKTKSTPTKSKSKSKTTTRAALEPSDDEDDEKPIKKIAAAAKSDKKPASTTKPTKPKAKSPKKPAPTTTSAASSPVEPNLEKDVVFGSRKFKSNWYKSDDHFYRQLIYKNAARFQDKLDERPAIVAAIQNQVENSLGGRFWKHSEDGSYTLLTNPKAEIKKSMLRVQTTQKDKQKREQLKQEENKTEGKTKAKQLKKKPSPPGQKPDESSGSDDEEETTKQPAKAKQYTTSKVEVEDVESSSADGEGEGENGSDTEMGIEGENTTGAEPQDESEGTDGDEGEPESWWSSFVSMAEYVAGSLFGKDIVDSIFGRKRERPAPSEQASPSQPPRKRRRVSNENEEESNTI